MRKARPAAVLATPRVLFIVLVSLLGSVSSPAPLPASAAPSSSPARFPAAAAGRAPAPIAPVVRRLRLAGVDRPALRSAETPASEGAAREALAEDRPGANGASERSRQAPAPARPAPSVGRPEVLTAPRVTAPFATLGVSWRPAGGASELSVVARTQGPAGWSPWFPLTQDDAPDTRVVRLRGLRATTDPYYAGNSRGVQVRVDVLRGRLPQDLRVELIDPGTSPADDLDTPDLSVTAEPAAAGAVSAPPIRTRRSWGADESRLRERPRYNATVKAGFVHHTAGINGYAPGEVPRILRGLYAYAQSGGYSDVNYNFLVDRFGRLWEGRAGGTSRPVKAGHAGGFNIDTFAVAAMGNYDRAGVPAGMVDSIARLMAWKLSLHGRDPLGTTTLVSEGRVGTSRYPRGARVPTRVITPHRRTGYTSCPGDYLNSYLPSIRQKARAYMGAALLSPSRSVKVSKTGAVAVRVRAGVIGDQDWSLTVTTPCAGVVRSYAGRATRARPIDVTWDGRPGTGGPPRPGRYTVTLRSSVPGGRTARSFVSTVDIPSRRANPRPPRAVPLVGNLGYVPLAVPTRLLDTRSGAALPLGPGERLDLPVVGRGAVPVLGVKAVTLSVKAVCPTKATSLTAWPAGGPRPPAATVTTAARTVRGGLLTVPVGGNGRVSIANAAGISNVAVDVVGYYTTGAGSGYSPASPRRIYDSRSTGRPLGNGETRVLDVPPVQGTPGAAMTAALLNVTVSSDGGGFVAVNRAFVLAGTTDIPYGRRSTTSAKVVTSLSAGRYAVRNVGGPAHVSVDLVGFYAPGGSAGRYTPVPSTRFLDTRSGTPVRAGGARTVVVAGRGPVPPGARAVALMLTATRGSAATAVTAFARGGVRGPNPDIIAARSTTTGALVVLPVGLARSVVLANRAGSIHLTADVIGYYR